MSTPAVAQIGSGASLPAGACNDAGGSLYYLTSGDAGLYVCAHGVWTKQIGPGGGGGVPAGASILIDAGTCPDGYEENTALNGKTLIGTLAANGNVGTTGGADAITPQGSISAPLFTGTPFSSVINHTHTVTITDPGHTHGQGIRNTGTAGALGVQGGSAANNATLANAVPSAATGISAATANPSGGVASITPAGTVSAPTLTGVAFDNRSAFVRVIVCKKT